MPCGLLQERGSRPEVRREREVLGPQFPDRESQGALAIFSGRWSQGRGELHAGLALCLERRGVLAAVISLGGTQGDYGLTPGTAGLGFPGSEGGICLDLQSA